jgi:hypothetical protein
MTIGAVLSALAAIPAIFGYVQSFVAQVMVWYIQNANNQTLSAIADAAALASRAKTDEERYAAAEAWQKALSRPRVSS